MFGAIGARSALAAVAGPLIGAILVFHNAFDLGWRSVFIINVPVGVVLFIAAAACIPESRSTKRVGLDFFGIGLISAALFLLVLGLIECRELGVASWDLGHDRGESRTSCGVHLAPR